MYKAIWVNPPREFLTQTAEQALKKYPQLRGPRAANLIGKFIREAGQQGDLAGKRHLQERHRLLSSLAEI
jgi:hypothetical protein